MIARSLSLVVALLPDGGFLLAWTEIYPGDFARGLPIGNP